MGYNLSKTAFTPAIGLAAVLFLTLGHATARAGSLANSTMSLSASVQATCTIAGNTLAFGVYSGQLIDATASLSVTCTNTTAYTVTLNNGTHAGSGQGGEGGDPNRRMAGPSSARLGYSLYANAGRTTQWLNDSESAVRGTGNGSAQLLTVYGRLPAAQYVTPGAFSDTITATVSY